MDFTSYWALWQKIRSHGGLIVLAILIFVTGWQTGHVMSPYYQAAPITFKEGAPEAHAGDTQALADLNTAGVALKPTPKPTVAAATTTAPNTNNAITTGQYVASKNSKLYHDTRCAAAKSISPANLITFASKEKAEAAGFSPGACTKNYLGL